MTMIRINLIAEKKTGSAKPSAAKKAPSQKSELEENLILIVCVALALGLAFWLNHKTKKEYQAAYAEHTRLKAEYEKVKKWKEEKEKYDIQKELLNEKIQKISDLKDKKVGPVKLMEDVNNVLPESVWLVGITQGYNNNLVQKSASMKQAFKPGSRLGNSNTDLVMVSGYAKTTDSITNFAKKILSLDQRYFETDLNSYTREEQGYSFNLFFRIKPAGGTSDQPEGGG